MTETPDYASICETVASEWQLGGMDGLYSDFATEVAKRAVTSALEAERWQPIETAPHETAVLLYSPPSYPSAPCIEVAFASSGREWAAPGGGRYSNVSRHAWATHWRPLPSPPEAP